MADFASRGLHGLDITVLRFFAMAQIAGYALGGCWTHIGCAQSVVAYAFSPIDLIPDALPIIGQADDLTVLLLVLDLFIANAPEDVRREHMERARNGTAKLDLTPRSKAGPWNPKPNSGASSLV